MNFDYKIAVLGYGSIPNQIYSPNYDKTLEVTKPPQEAGATNENTN